MIQQLNDHDMQHMEMRTVVLVQRAGHVEQTSDLTQLQPVRT